MAYTSSSILRKLVTSFITCVDAHTAAGKHVAHVTLLHDKKLSRWACSCSQSRVTAGHAVLVAVENCSKLRPVLQPCLWAEPVTLTAHLQALRVPRVQRSSLCKPLLVKISKTDPHRSTMHSLPPCTHTVAWHTPFPYTHLVLSAEDVCVVLHKAPHSSEATEGTTELIAVQHTKVSQPQRQLPAAARAATGHSTDFKQIHHA
jgi:hypothetical protein